MIKPRHRRITHNIHSAMQRSPRIIKHSIEVRILCKTEAGTALLGAVEDQVGAIRESDDVGDDALRGHAFDFPCRGGEGGFCGGAVIEGDFRAWGCAAAD